LLALAEAHHFVDVSRIRVNVIQAEEQLVAVTNELAYLHNIKKLFTAIKISNCHYLFT
jgi:hypothetical protein